MTHPQAVTLRPGDAMPRFANLHGVDGKQYASTDFADPVLIVVFSCNHCPYVQAYEDRMIALQRKYTSRGVRLVAINANETAGYPDDNYEGMVARSRLKAMNFPYLRDEDQSAAEAFGATHTPQFFLFDKSRTLRYSGKLDDNWKDPVVVKERYLEDAITAVLDGKEVPLAETMSIGCTIKWK